MYYLKLFLTLGLLIFSNSCTKEESIPEEYKLIGCWVEKNPERWDKISDTLVFTEDMITYKHFYYDGWKYRVEGDTIIFKKNSITDEFRFSLVSENEIVFYNFLTRLITAQVLDIYYIKLE